MGKYDFFLFFFSFFLNLTRFCPKEIESYVKKKKKIKKEWISYAYTREMGTFQQPSLVAND